jgi:hypothetical protein
MVVGHDVSFYELVEGLMANALVGMVMGKYVKGKTLKVWMGEH